MYRGLDILDIRHMLSYAFIQSFASLILSKTYLRHPSLGALARYPAVVPAPTPSLPNLVTQNQLVYTEIRKQERLYTPGLGPLRGYRIA